MCEAAQKSNIAAVQHSLRTDLSTALSSAAPFSFNAPEVCTEEMPYCRNVGLLGGLTDVRTSLCMILDDFGLTLVEV